MNIRFQYPNFIKSQYTGDYETKTPVKKEIFNLEREHKIINPHKMQLLTIKNTDYKSFEATPKAVSAK